MKLNDCFLFSSDYSFKEKLYIQNGFDIPESLEEQINVKGHYESVNQFIYNDINNDFLLQKINSVEKEKNDFINIINKKNSEEKTKIRFIYLINEYQLFLAEQTYNPKFFNEHKNKGQNNINCLLFIKLNNIFSFLKKKNYNR